MKQRSCLLLGVLLLLMVLGSQNLVLASEDKVLVPDFALLDKHNETVRLSDYRGKVVVLNFWASRCPLCRAEMDELQALHRELEQGDDAVLLLINQIDGSRETIEIGTAYLEDNNYEMHNLFDHGTVGMAMFGIPGLPTTVVIDGEGYLDSYVVGPTTKKNLLGMIEEAK